MSETAATPSTKALAEPTVRVPGIYLAGMALANLGIMLAFYTPIQNLLPPVVRADRRRRWQGSRPRRCAGYRGHRLGDRQPAGGALSDRTTSRFGRRRPWMLGGALLGMVALFILPSMNTIIGLTILWLFIQFSVNASYAALTATIPDQVPVEQRGVASGWVGLAQTLGIVLGSRWCRSWCWV